MSEMAERQRAHFNSISSRYAAARRHPNHLLLKELMWARFLEGKRRLAPARSRVLEPMCGVGEGLEIVRRHLQPHIDYCGFDYSEEMLREARARFPGESFAWQDVTAFEAAGERFDWIVLIGGLHHVFAQSADVVARLAGALRPGGHFLSYEPTQNCALTRAVRRSIYRRNGLFDVQSEQGFDLGVLESHFRAAGFDLVDEVSAGLLAYVLHYNPDAFPRLNLGGERTVRASFAIDRLLWRGWLGRKLSFATMSLWRLR